MRKRVVTVEPDTPINDAARLMADKKIGCVPVVESGTLIGLVTTTDVLRYVGRVD
jgi:CBS domain-containing protein